MLEVVSVARFLKVLTKAFIEYYFCFSFEKTSFAKMFAILKSVADPYSVNPYSDTGFLLNFESLSRSRLLRTKIERKIFIFFIKGFPKGLIISYIQSKLQSPQRERPALKNRKLPFTLFFFCGTFLTASA
jgi:hypothetical protein